MSKITHPNDNENSTLTEAGSSPRSTRVIAITSGKGGVGKTCFSANVAIAMQRKRKKTLIIDADLGLANIDVILGLRPRYNLSHLIDGKVDIDEVLTRGPGGIDILPAGSGIESVSNLDSAKQMALLEKLGALEGRYDMVLIDTGAGIASNVVYFNLAAQTSIVVVTPEPTSKTDAYALIKVMSQNYSQKRFQILVNQVRSETEGRTVYQSLAETADRHLDEVSLGYLGALASDPQLSEAIRQQTAAVELFPDSRFATQIRALGARLANLRVSELNGSLGFFFSQLLDPTMAQSGLGGQ